MVRRMMGGMKALGIAALLAGTTSGVDLHATVQSPGGEAVVDDPRVEVSISARQVSLYRGGERVATYSIGVGESDWPTQTGEWSIYQIDFNPDWTPPEEGWASDSEYKEPGHPDNPMGRVRIIYDPPRSIHGTDDEDSIGRAESHGSIRIRNDDGFELARLLMDAAGEERSSEWVDRVLENESEMVSVELSNPIPIRVREE
ncbi:MAG: L,D-transpeptidase [Gemmatimonadetes bacterium]|nr:L,D-transpeptidase [Gemmatimonadota bacterium]